MARLLHQFSAGLLQHADSRFTAFKKGSLCSRTTDVMFFIPCVLLPYQTLAHNSTQPPTDYIHSYPLS